MRSTIIFYPNTLKKQAKNGRIPIYLRALHNNEKAEARLNEEIAEEDLLKWNQMTMRLDDRSSTLNKILNSISNRFDDFKKINAGKLHQYDAKRVRDVLMCNEEKHILTIDDYANAYYSDFIAPEGHITQGTKKNSHQDSTLPIELSHHCCRLKKIRTSIYAFIAQHSSVEL